MLPIILAIATSNHYCWMETPSGQTISLEHLCGAENEAADSSTARFESEVSDAIAVRGWDASEWDVVDLGQRYCELRGRGLSADEVASIQAQQIVSVYGGLDDEPLTVLSAVAASAPEYLCPQFGI